MLSEGDEQPIADADETVYEDFLINIEDYVELSIVRNGEDSAPIEKLNFTSNLTVFESRDVKVDLDFEHPLLVSIGANGLDSLKVTFKDTSLFIDAETGLSFDKNTRFILKIPKQIPKEHAYGLELALKILRIVFTTILVVGLLLLCFMSDSVKTLWIALHAFQVWAYFYMFHMEHFPVNTKQFLMEFNRIVYFQWFADLFGLTHSFFTNATAAGVTGEEQVIFTEELKLMDPSIFHCLGIVIVLLVGLAGLLVLAALLAAGHNLTDKIPRLPAWFVLAAVSRFLILTFLQGVHLCVTYFLIPAELKASRLVLVFIICLLSTYLIFVPFSSLMIYLKRK